ncbi:protein kinase, partial [Pediococcus acidilactici]|nr:protein kinase [Pediococcus acidilactici]
MMTPNQTLIGRYKIIRPVGEGGMASVYLAHDLILDRDVAVKLVRFDMQDDASAVRRFQREALSATELVHPNIVSVYDIGEEHGMNYLVMEYVEGKDLKRYIKDEFPLPLPQVVFFFF